MSITWQILATYIYTKKYINNGLQTIFTIDVVEFGFDGHHIGSVEVVTPQSEGDQLPRSTVGRSPVRPHLVTADHYRQVGPEHKDRSCTITEACIRLDLYIARV